MIDAFLAHMKESGWKIELNERDVHVPKTVSARYTNISELWLEFIRKVKKMVNSDETVWFLGAEDFEMQGDAVFRWNEWELISLENAEDDEWKCAISEFWNNHLPIVMSVKDGYAYFAISIKDGSIVQGAEPEFEECGIVARSFSNFIEKIKKDELCL